MLRPQPPVNVRCIPALIQLRCRSGLISIRLVIKIILSSECQAPIKYHHLIINVVSGHGWLRQGRTHGSLWYSQLGRLLLQFLCLFQNGAAQALPEGGCLTSTSCIISWTQHIDLWKVSRPIRGLFLQHTCHHAVIVMLFLLLICQIFKDVLKLGIHRHILRGWWNFGLWYPQGWLLIIILVEIILGFSERC